MASKGHNTKIRAPVEGTSETKDGTLSTRSKALVFISHDSRDADLAEAFGNLLSDVSGGTLKSFRSSDKTGTAGIAFGEEWYAAIMARLDDATDVVALFTLESVDRPWILYETGVAKGKLSAKVFGIALGIPLDRVLTGPFGQFQNSGDDEDSLTKLVMQLLKRNPDAAPREEAVRNQVGVFKKNLEAILSKRGKKKDALPANTEEQNTAKLFEELKALVKDLPDQVDERVRTTSKRGPLRRMRKFHPGMLEEIFFDPEMRGTNQGAAAALLIFVSLMREDIPWMYEPGMELYRALRAGKASSIEDARRQMMSIVKATTHGPFMHEIMRPDDDGTFYMMRHMPDFMDHILSRIRIERASRGSAGSKAVSRSDHT